MTIKQFSLGPSRALLSWLLAGRIKYLTALKVSTLTTEHADEVFLGFPTVHRVQAPRDRFPTKIFSENQPS